jgi:hypothetical protein
MIVYHVRVETGFSAEPQFKYPSAGELREGDVITHDGRSYIVLAAIVDPFDHGLGNAKVRPGDA